MACFINGFHNATEYLLVQDNTWAELWYPKLYLLLLPHWYDNDVDKNWGREVSFYYAEFQNPKHWLYNFLEYYLIYYIYIYIFFCYFLLLLNLLCTSRYLNYLIFYKAGWWEITNQPYIYFSSNFEVNETRWRLIHFIPLIFFKPKKDMEQ